MHGELIGTIRLIPFGHGLAPCETVLARHPEVAGDLLDDGWEAGRLVLSPGYRTQPDILRNCLSLVLRRFIEDQPTVNFFASCNPLLARLYRRFGFTVLIKDACEQDGTQFALIHGNERSVQLAVDKEGVR